MKREISGLSGNGGAAALLAFMLLLPAICASAAERVSLANASVPPPATGAGDSTLAAVSADGRRVAFVSQARDLVAYQSEGATFNVFVRDLETGLMWLASINATGASGGNGPSTLPTLSSNGQFVAFESSASDLVTNDLNGASDVFVRDLEAGTTVLVSVNSSASGSGLGISSNPVMTPDGRYVFFESTALNLVSGDSNGASDVFVRDLMLNTTTLISKRFNATTSATGGSSHSPMPGADGRVVAFLSTATNLAVNTTRTTNNLFFRNLETGVTRMVGIFPPGTANVTVQALNPVLSAGGERLAFRALSSNTNLVPDGVYWCNLVEDTFGRIDPTNAVTTPRVGLGDFSGPVMSADGLIVAYESARAGFAGAARDIQVWNGVTGETTMISFEPSLGNASRNFRPILNAAGTHVAFASNVGSVGSTNAPSDFQLYVHDLSRRTNVLASAGLAAGGANAGDCDWAAPVFSAKGGLLAFQSRSDNLVANDHNRALDILVRDLAASATRLISARATSAPPAEATGLSSLEGGTLSQDGRWLAFFSEAANLVPNDTNGVRDVFVRDLLSGSNILVSVNAEGTAAGNGLSQRPSISVNGRWVGFVSGASDLVAGDTNRWDDVFLRNLDTGQTKLLSINNDGTGLDSALPHSPAFSSDGRWVVYRDARKIFVWDTQEGTNAAVSVSSDGSQVLAEAGTISPDGRYVAFVAGGLLYVRDRQNATTLPVAASPVFPSAQFSDDNSQLVFQVNAPTDFNLYVHALATTSNRLVTATASGLPSSNRVPAEARLSANSRFLVFASDAALVDGITNTTRDIYVRDLGTATTALVSVNYEGKAGGNDRSDSPAISADGRFVVFRSLATNLVGNDTNRQADVFLRDLAAGTTRLVSQSGFGYGSGNQRSARPLISAGGEVILFQSTASDLVISDFNQVQDLFYFRNLAGTVDSDGDAMDDVWESSHFNSLARDGQGDFDQDGMSDADEFRAGTEPTDAASAFVGELIESPQNGVFTLRWNSVPGAVYRVQYRNDLKTSLWTSLAGDVVADGPIAVKGDPTAPFRAQRYYRILLLR